MLGRGDGHFLNLHLAIKQSGPMPCLAIKLSLLRSGLLEAVAVCLKPETMTDGDLQWPAGAAAESV